MIARVLARFGLETARGSSSRRGKEAYRELAESLQSGLDVAITPDGPRGPCYQAHIGVVGLAGSSGHAVIPVTCRIQWKFELPTWDRFILPLPFSFCTLHFGKPLNFTADEREELLEKGKMELETCLNRLN